MPGWTGDAEWRGYVAAEELPRIYNPTRGFVVADLNQRYRVTFTHAGTFNYHCAYHDNLGMLGQVIVLP